MSPPEGSTRRNSTEIDCLPLTRNTAAMGSMVKKMIHKAVRPYGKYSFVSALPPKASILDVGCGNNSPYWTKRILPDCLYTGIDIGDYNQTCPNKSDRYIVTSPESFPREIAKEANKFDAVISSHNLEHCLDRDQTLSAILASLKKGGLLYLSFPTEKSVSFPSRGGTLRYDDDDTHLGHPPDFDAIVQTLEQNNFEIIFSTKEYKPSILWMYGWISEPYSRIKNHTSRGTWAYYGFESIIWAKKRQ